MINPIDTAKVQESAVLIGVQTKGQPDELTTEHLDELSFLAETAGTKVLKRFVQKLTTERGNKSVQRSCRPTRYV